jgi:carboxymethylenebutenolidase
MRNPEHACFCRGVASRLLQKNSQITGERQLLRFRISQEAKLKAGVYLKTGAVLAIAVASLSIGRAMAANEQMDHGSHAAEASAGSIAVDQGAIPPGEADALARLNSSPRHGEWVTFQSGKNPVTGANDSTRAWIVWPQRSDRAPVVVVIHEIFGLTPWIRAVADQLAADGFIAIAPDFLTMKNVAGNPADGPVRNAATAAIRGVTTEEVNRFIDAAAKYAMALPAALPKYGVVGYCWGGEKSFSHAAHSASVGAAVVYYGTTPALSALSSVRAPVLGLYGGNDARVNGTVPAADSAMKAMRKSFTPHTFDGAGHGFLRQPTPADLEASRKAWPLTIQFFKTHLGA